MVRGSRLSETEMGMIRALIEDKVTPTEIARHLHRSPKAVRKYQRAMGFGRWPSNQGPTSKISQKVVRTMTRKADTDLYNDRELQNNYGLDVGVRRVQQMLHDVAHLAYKKILVAPPLAPKHKRARMEWAPESLHTDGKLW